MLPYALLCGMTTEEFWYGEPRYFSSYIKKHELELDEMNYNAWLFGFYNYKAFSSIISNVFSKEGSETQIYFEKPLENFFSNFKVNKENLIKKDKDKYRKQINYWSKLGKKGK